MTSTDVEVYEAHPPATLFGSDDPGEVVARASAAAKPLAEVVNSQKLFAMIGGKKHVLVEGYCLLGSMLGVFPVTVWTRKTETGWEARVEARTKHGEVVGAAEASCDRDEKNWKSRDDFALRSMAQTRATSKALRQPLGFVMTLAGYAATPAEEMPREPIADSEPIRDPDGNPFPDQGDVESVYKPPPGALEGRPRGSITEAQNRMIRRLVTKLGKAPYSVPEETLLTQLQLQYEKNDWMALDKGEATAVIDDLKKQADE